MRAAGGGSQSRVGGWGKSNTAGNTDGSRVSNVILETETNSPLASATGLELHQPIMSMIGGHGGQLER